MKVKLTQKQSRDIESFFDLLKSESGLIEAFFVKPNNTGRATRFYDHNGKEKFINEVLAFNSQGFTCYAGIQPRNKELLKGNRAGTDADVVGLRFLYLDLDPIRQGDCNATDEERMHCHEVASNIQKDFVKLGYSEPILISSGNGFWLFVRVPEIPITEENRADMSQRLKAWGEKARVGFQTEGVKIDSIYDLRRVTKIPGTRVFNHPDTTQRPQRVAEIVSEVFPEPCTSLRERFLAMPVKVAKKHPAIIGQAHNIDRIFAKCYLMQFIKIKGGNGINLPHGVRLALSSFSLALGDLENGLCFIKQIIGGCPDFSEQTTSHYLRMNRGKSNPYGCEKLRSLVIEHFSDFQVEKCNCNLAPSFDVSTGTVRKPSPIRFAYAMEEDLQELCKELRLSDDRFVKFRQLKDFTHEYLTSFDSATCKRFFESKKKDWKLRKEDTKDLLKYHQGFLKIAHKETPTVEISEDKKEKALEILRRPSLLYDYGRAIQGLGLVNEDKNVRILILTLTSRLQDTMVNLIIKGESSAGKSYLLKKCLEAFPEDFFHEFTSMSSRALIYTEKDFQHKFVIIYEFDGQNDEMNYLIRTLQSEGRLKYEYTVKDDGNFITNSIDKKGPTGFITTTTKAETFDENETRLFSLYIDESEGQTKEIIKRLGARFENNGKYSLDEEITTWKNVQKLLKPYPVIIPYASWIADQIPTGKIRVRRDFERVMLTISVCALLHQHQRDKVSSNGVEYIRASIVDYLMVRDLLEGTLVQTVYNQSPKTQRIVEAIIRIYEEKRENSGSNDLVKEESEGIGSTDIKKGLVTMNDLVKEMGYTRKTIYTWLAPAINNGYVQKISEGRYSTGYYKPTDKADQFDGSGQTFLPAPEALINAFPDLSKGVRYVNPITGKETIIEDDGRSEGV